MIFLATFWLMLFAGIQADEPAVIDSDPIYTVDGPLRDRLNDRLEKRQEKRTQPAAPSVDSDPKADSEKPKQGFLGKLLNRDPDVNQKRKSKRGSKREARRKTIRLICFTAIAVVLLMIVKTIKG